jgi:hypothetical protein
LKRPLTFAALALMLLGVEVATGAVSVGLIRLWTGFGALLSGDEAIISSPRYVSGMGLLLTGSGLLVAMLWVQRAETGILTEGSTCPKCGTATKRVRRRKRHRVLSRILETNVTHRHCERCGWNGLAA